MSVQYVIDEHGEKTSVLLSMNEYQRIIDLLEELEDIKEFDARTSNLDTIPFEEIEQELRVQD